MAFAIIAALNPAFNKAFFKQAARDAVVGTGAVVAAVSVAEVAKDRYRQFFGLKHR